MQTHRPGVRRRPVRSVAALRGSTASLTVRAARVPAHAPRIVRQRFELVGIDRRTAAGGAHRDPHGADPAAVRPPDACRPVRRDP